MRAALYWTPELSDPLFDAGNAWLGRDAETGALLSQPALDGIAAQTEEARRYGFHATLKPPFRIATSWDAVEGAAVTLARGLAPFDLAPLRVASIDGFLALRESGPCAALGHLADACVLGLDRHRAPPDEAELSRRRAGGLSAAQERNLVRYGYPYVLDTWFFHMTLSRRLNAADFARLEQGATLHFAGALSLPRRVESVCLFTEAAPGAPFLLARRLKLGG